MKLLRLGLVCFLTALTWLTVAEFLTAQETEVEAGNAEKVDAEKVDGEKHTNALADESSPYLLMHAHNPVNWYPWNEETLQRAKDEGKPIFLSIGYSSCHWCHVMERESFLDEEIANFLNANFVCIKVDREERPDVDQIYMESLNIYNQLTRNGQGGGWPLSMFLTPESKPFFGGTYFPARDGDRGTRKGFLTIVKLIQENWTNNQDNVRKTADQLTDITRKQLEGQPPLQEKEIKARWITRAIDQLERSFDASHGGFGFVASNPNRPKFPEASNLMFLLEFIEQASDPEKVASAKKMLTKTLGQMALGGIYDHIGGGFHRYSVDRFWAIPHFEKMLYDNAQLATAYSAAYQIDAKDEYRRTVAGILEFVEAEMTSPQGGFYSALDAESEGVEGKYYRWEKEEIRTALSEADFNVFAETYRLNEAPNFENEYYAPQLKQPLDNAAFEQLSAARKTLFDIRSKRARPLLDNKILTSWNGMMIRGFADAGRVFENQHYLDVASKAATFCLDQLVGDDGRLYRTHTDGVSKLNAYLDDYASLIEGLCALHRATGDAKWIDAAKKLQAKQDELFWDEKNGGYFYTSADHETLIVRTKRAADNAVPSGSSVAAGNLIYFSQVSGESSAQDRAKQTVLSASGLLKDYPLIAPRMLVAAQRLLEDE